MTEEFQQMITACGQWDISVGSLSCWDLHQLQLHTVSSISSGLCTNTAEWNFLDIYLSMFRYFLSFFPWPGIYTCYILILFFCLAYYEVRCFSSDLDFRSKIHYSIFWQIFWPKFLHLSLLWYPNILHLCLCMILYFNIGHIALNSFNSVLGAVLYTFWRNLIHRA